MGAITSLECSVCRKPHPPGTILNLCECGGPLLVRYDLPSLAQSWNRAARRDAPSTMWRYAPVLPVSDPAHIVSLGEGWTPLLQAHRLGRDLGFSSLWIKDEGLNPTASFKARGMACAVSMCVELGISKLAVPSAGNASGALAAYAARAGLEAHVFMPRDVPAANYIECRAFGAHVTLVDGLISDCARMVNERKDKEGWFDLSTLKEPYRIEGKKTMGYEVAEQFGWELPDAILYPAGGGVGLIGMWKAFEEMQQLGWIGAKRPKMIAVQTTGCAPVVQAFENGDVETRFWQGAHTVASGLRVPRPLGDRLMLQAIRDSSGTAIAVTDQALMDSTVQLAAAEGVFAAPEGGACIAALRILRARGILKPEDRVVVFNTGSGLKYLDAFSRRFPRTAASEQDKLGGLITPR